MASDTLLPIAPGSIDVVMLLQNPQRFADTVGCTPIPQRQDQSTQQQVFYSLAIHVE